MSWGWPASMSTIRATSPASRRGSTASLTISSTSSTRGSNWGPCSLARRTRTGHSGALWQCTTPSWSAPGRLALGADSLLGMVDSLLLDLEADEPGVVPFSDEQGLFVVEMLSAVGQSWFNDAVIPGEPLTEDAWWTDIKARLARRGGDSRYVSEFLLPELVDHLVTVREHFWPKVEQIVATPEGHPCP